MFDQFKGWLVKANADYRIKKQELQERQRKAQSALVVRRKEEEQRLRVLKALPPV